MIDVHLTSEPTASVTADALVVAAFAEEDGHRLSDDGSAVDEAMGGALSGFLESARFEAKPGQTKMLPGTDAVGADVVLVVGLGKADDVDHEAVRRASGVAARALCEQESIASTLASVLDDRGVATRAVVEGALLGAYKYTAYKSEPNEARTTRLVVVDGDEEWADYGRAVAGATSLARDLSNQPSGDLPPRTLADRAVDAAEPAGLDFEVWDLERITQEKLGGIESVGRGSDEEPRLVRLTYIPDGEPSGTVCLVGKGITFDSGGLSLKPPDGMTTMKTDMSGAAAVIGVMSALGSVRPSCKVVGYVASAENMPSGSAIRPGDVFTARNGKTVEVLNTDAEGRLVLADGLSLAAEDEPDAIVDVATLTGACVVALGNQYAGLLSNDETLASALDVAAVSAGEHVWRLPLAKEYRKQLDSEVADLKNIGNRGGGAITAALFLQEFVGDTPWAHLDIAGPSRNETTDAYTPKGSTGFGVRTLLDFLREFDASAEH